MAASQLVSAITVLGSLAIGAALAAGIQVRVKTLSEGSQIIKVWTDPSDTVRAFKTKIAYHEAFPVDQQNLLFGAHQLKDERLLSDYNIQEDSLLRMIVRNHGVCGGRPMKLRFKTTNNEQFALEANSADRVEDLKFRIESARGHDVRDLRLLFGGVHMQNERLLSDFNLQDNSYVQMKAVVPFESLKLDQKSPRELELERESFD